MINVTLKGEQVSVKPATLQNYIDRVEYIKSRRISPIDSLASMSGKIPEGQYFKFVEIAISSSMKLSSVDFEEEMLFDSSTEGWVYTVWQALRDQFKWPKEPIFGVIKAAEYYESLSKEDKKKLNAAIRGVDEMVVAGKSDSPTPTEQPE